jgi:hypothetical protein
MHLQEFAYDTLVAAGVLPYTSECGEVVYGYAQGSQEWAKERQLRITASDAALALGESVYGSPDLVIRRKFGSEQQTAAMSRGRELEPAIADAYIKLQQASANVVGTATYYCACLYSSTCCCCRRQV